MGWLSSNEKECGVLHPDFISEEDERESLLEKQRPLKEKKRDKKKEK